MTTYSEAFTLAAKFLDSASTEIDNAIQSVELTDHISELENLVVERGT